MWQCDSCGAESPLYNSCGDRHCPKCQARKRAEWFERRRQELLPVEYFHVVFTVPHTLAVLAAAHPKEFYQLLLRAVRETLLEVAANPRQLGARIGGVMVLHTWGQTLQRHPHVHVIVPGGGLSPDGQQWISCPRGFFLPGKILRSVFRAKLLEFWREAHATGGLSWRGSLAPLADPARFEQFLSEQYREDWVVHIEPPTAGADAERMLKYLARYTYRVAIANDRIESIENGQVTFRYKDYTQGGRWRT
ncbi:MAG: transposase, partial [Planctomycetales bacterium]